MRSLVGLHTGVNFSKGTYLDHLGLHRPSFCTRRTRSLRCLVSSKRLGDAQAFVTEAKDLAVV